ncbi:MAG TPA: histidine kinase dimerization/phosphoacceptor domain -containing protein [Bacteroidia bacterium]|jgi:two-component sensor histidine kinase|nr:histidine kinase dimerization/phosphoacceptor domain -containing protein [Bacteroidia bacterium]
MYDESINLLEELDNVSRIHVLNRDDIDALMIEFARRILATLRIERVNVWLFNTAKDAIISIGEYDMRTHVFSKDSILYKKDFPAYFEAINEDRIVLAPNIHTHPSTFQFSESYSTPNGIISLMDVPLRFGGELVGVICFEKTGDKERWFSEKEQTFALSVSLVLASNLEARHRRAVQYKLENIIKEKELLIQEINHRVKNNFSILISLLRISRQQGKTTNPQIILEEYEQRIFSMLKIQELLYQSNNYTSINLTDYITELINEFKSSQPEIETQVHCNIPHLETMLPSKTAIHVGLIVTEICLNSFKYGRINNNNYTLSITIKQNPDGSILLNIGDNGDGFDFEKAPGENSMGLHLIRDLCDDIGIKASFPKAGYGTYSFIFNT